MVRSSLSSGSFVGQRPENRLMRCPPHLETILEKVLEEDDSCHQSLEDTAGSSLHLDMFGQTIVETTFTINDSAKPAAKAAV